MLSIVATSPPRPIFPTEVLQGGMQEVGTFNLEQTNIFVALLTYSFKIDLIVCFGYPYPNVLKLMNLVIPLILMLHMLLSLEAYNGFHAT